jgi:hypothetical protein
MNVLIPNAYDENWREFYEALFEALFDSPRDHRGCSGAYDHAEELLAERGYNVEASLELYADRGGGCDCEILFNVDPPTDDLAGAPATK